MTDHVLGVPLRDVDQRRPPPQARQTLLESVGVSIVDFRCQAHVEPLGPEEPNPTHGIVFVRKGVFLRKQHGETLVADANHVLFFNAGEPYRYSHPLSGGDECTILVVDGDRALDLVGRHAPPRDAERPETPFPLGHGLASTLAARRHYELLALMHKGAPRLVLEDVVAELADEAVGSAYRMRGVRTQREPVSTSARLRRRELVEAAKLAVNERLASLPSLGELARGFGCSPFHLSRIFHRTAGMSLRAYVGRLCARRAAARLAEGVRDLTELALELGYADHSHFTNTFRQEWGVPPSRLRDFHRAPADGLRNILQAAHKAEN